jgi:hypothetical protein
MTAAIVQLCSDPRLNHEVIRPQIAARLERLQLRAERIFLLNDVGGNVGDNTRNTIDLLRRQRELIVLAAVLHHDDCLAAQQGLRRDLDATARQLTGMLVERNIDVPVLTGHLVTENSTLLWDDEPHPNFESFAFRMPRMFG